MNPFSAPKFWSPGSRAFFNGPGFLSWSRGQGQSDVGGLDSFLGSTRAGASTAAGVGALPEWWFEQQARLGKRIMGGMTELGITPILRGFEGNIPPSLGLKAREANPP